MTIGRDGVRGAVYEESAQGSGERDITSSRRGRNTVGVQEGFMWKPGA